MGMQLGDESLNLPVITKTISKHLSIGILGGIYSTIVAFPEYISSYIYLNAHPEFERKF